MRFGLVSGGASSMISELHILKVNKALKPKGLMYA